MNYLDTQFNDNLERDLFPVSGQLSSLDMDSVTQSLDIGKLTTTGSLKSSDGRLAFDLEGNTYIVNDGTIERVRLGRMDDGSYGLRIQDKDGNVILNITGETNLLQSSNGHMQLDLTAEQMRIYDETNLRILLGKGENLF